MNILAVGFDLNETDREQVNKITTACKLSLHKIEVKDIKTSTTDFSDVDFLIVFGERAGRTLIPLAKENGMLHISLPTIRNLYPLNEGGVAEDRLRTFKELSNLAEALKAGQLKVIEDKKILLTMQLPIVISDLSVPSIQALEKVIRESGRTSWTCATKDGKVVGITLDTKQPEPEGVDFCITFAELLMMRAAVDILKIEGITFVSTSKPTTDKSS